MKELIKVLMIGVLISAVAEEEAKKLNSNHLIKNVNEDELKEREKKYLQKMEKELSEEIRNEKIIMWIIVGALLILVAAIPFSMYCVFKKAGNNLSEVISIIALLVSILSISIGCVTACFSSIKSEISADKQQLREYQRRLVELTGYKEENENNPQKSNTEQPIKEASK